MLAQHGAPQSETSPQLAVIVIAVGAAPLLVGAVRSLLAQDTAPEILLVNSGGGDVRGLLARHGLAVPLLELPRQVYAGEARNAGIAATTAPYVAFLASDCRATPGWVAERLRLHRAGHEAVASALLNDKPGSLVAWAHHLVNFAARLPGLPAEKAIRYGTSFDRRVFARIGHFAPALRSGEDSDLQGRLAAPPLWAPTVRTLHVNSRNIPAICRECYWRGYRAGIDSRRILGLAPEAVAPDSRRAVENVAHAVRQGLEGQDRRMALRSLPLVDLFLRWRARGVRAMRPLLPAIDSGRYRDPPPGVTPAIWQRHLLASGA